TRRRITGWRASARARLEGAEEVGYRVRAGLATIGSGGLHNGRVRRPHFPISVPLWRLITLLMDDGDARIAVERDRSAVRDELQCAFDLHARQAILTSEQRAVGDEATR